MKKTKLLVVTLGAAVAALAVKCIMLYKKNQDLSDILNEDGDWDVEELSWDDEEDIFEADDCGTCNGHCKNCSKKEDDNPKVGENLTDSEDTKENK